MTDQPENHTPDYVRNQVGTYYPPGSAERIALEARWVRELFGYIDKGTYHLQKMVARVMEKPT